MEGAGGQRDDHRGVSSTEEFYGSVPEAAPADVDAAVALARRAFDDPSGWATWSPAQRAEVIERFAVALEQRGEETARRVTLQNGMPWALSSAVEAVFPALLLRYYARMAQDRPFEETRRACSVARRASCASRSASSRRACRGTCRRR